MIKKSIVFAAFDEEYVATIEFKLAKLTEERASIEFITDAGCLEAFLERPKKIDVLILPYGIPLPHPEAFSKTSIYYLTEEEMDAENPAYIYKYYSVKRMLEKIDSGLITEAESEKGTKVVGVFSASGGTGKTITALTLAHKLMKKGKRVIYISTVPYQDFTYYIDDASVLGTAFCYQCSINIKNALKIIQDEVKNEGFDFLPPFKNLPVSYQMKFSVYSQIVDYLRDKNIYDYIVVELSSELEADKLVFLKNCDWKVLLTTQDKIAVGKLEALLSNMLDFDRNILILCNRYKYNQPDFLSGAQLLQKYEFSEFIEEYNAPLDLEMTKNSQLFDRTILCME